MIYFCIPSHNEAATVGPVLWKLRRVLEESAREYQLLVGDDGSTDHTVEALEPYLNVLPLSILRNATPLGTAATVERLLKEALERSDRHKRDVAIVLPADFTVDPSDILEFLKRLDSGADLVVGEAHLEGEPDPWRRRIRRWAPWLLGRAVRVPGIKDIVSGVVAFRLVALRNAFRDRSDRWLATEGWAANAELLAAAAAGARRIEAVPITERADRRQRPSRQEPWPLAKELWRARRRLKQPQGGAASLPGGRPPQPKEAA